MGYIRKIARVRAAEEVAFGTDGTGTMGNFYGVRCDTIEAPPPVKRARLKVDPLRSFRTQESAEEFGFAHGQLSLGGDMCSIGTEIANGVTTTKDGMSKVLEKCIGSYRTGEGSVVATGTSETEFIVDAGDGAQMLAAQLVLVETAAGSARYTPFVVGTRSTDTLTGLVDLPAAPAVGAKVLNTQMIYESDDPTATLQWLVEYFDRDDIALYAGAIGDLSLTFENGAKVAWSSTQQFTLSIHDDELAGVQGGSALAVFSHDAGTPVVARGGSVHFGPAAATTRVTAEVAKIELAPSIAWTFTDSFNGVEGRSGVKAMIGEPMCSVFVRAGTETYKDAYAAGTKYRLLGGFGNVGGKTIVLHLPNMQIVDIDREEMNGIWYEKLTCKLLAADTFADQSADALRSRYYIGRG